MRTYHIVPKPDVLDWNAIPVAPVDQMKWTPPVDISATAQVCYDDQALYVRLTAREAQIRAEESGPLGVPCQDSCLEFFFAPVEGDPRYLNLEFNSVKCMHLGIGTCRYDSVRMLPDPDATFGPCPVRTEDGWEITYQIPYSFLRLFYPDFQAAPGKKMRANFYKCGDYTVQEHYLSWNPVESQIPDFHRPESFGQLIFD
jgi:hypothetical protein